MEIFIFKWQLFSTFCLKETLLNDWEFEEKYLIHVKLSFKNGLFSTSKLYEIVLQRKVELDKRLLKLDNIHYSHLHFSTEKWNWLRNSVFWKFIHLSLQYLFIPPHGITLKSTWKIKVQKLYFSGIKSTRIWLGPSQDGFQDAM